MKKFLRWDLFSGTDVPASLDKRILATAAMRSTGYKRKRRIMFLTLPTAAAAAAALLVGGVMYSDMFSPGAAPHPGVSPAQEMLSIPHTEMLALADMTALEQVNFTVALMSENEFSEENFVI